MKFYQQPQNAPISSLIHKEWNKMDIDRETLKLNLEKKKLKDCNHNNK